MVEDEVVVEGGDVVGAEVDMETIKVFFCCLRSLGSNMLIKCRDDVIPNRC